jgi:DNA replication protein DnaC
MHRENKLTTIAEQAEQLLPRSAEQVTKPSSEVYDPEYKHITLSEEEIKEALRVGRREKHYLLAKIAYQQKLNEARPIQCFTAIQLKDRLVRSKMADGNRFIIDEDNEDQINFLCLYFAQDERAKKAKGMSMEKGIGLLGGIGVGKTHLLSFFSQNQLQSYRVMSCRRIENLWVEAGKAKDEQVDVIQSYIEPKQIAVNADPFGHQTIGLCLDDLGTETIPSKRFGEEKNVMSEIILGRYDNRHLGNLTHFTTNLNAEKIAELYGDRVRDRLREMCNIITFPDQAKSRRK